MLRESVGAEAVIGGMCQVIATLNEHGEVVQIGPVHDLFIGSLGLTPPLI